MGEEVSRALAAYLLTVHPASIGWLKKLAT